MFNKNVWVYVTRECNLACPYCYNKINASASLMQDREVSIRVRFLLDKLLAEGRMECLMLTGGEPMLVEETYNLIDYFRRKVKLAIYTNGTLLSYENIKRLSGVEVKISLHGAMESISGLRRYANMIPILESENIRYGFIYMVTAENYKYLHDAYLFLRSASKYGGFSMKYQPLVVQKDEGIKNNQLRERFSLCNLSLPEWNILEKEIQKTILYEANNPLPNKNPIFSFDESTMKYFILLRDFYLYGKKPLVCNNVPIIIIGSDGHVRPCMFRFDRIISSATGQETPYGDLIRDMSPDEVEKMRCAQCFSEQCVCALKPTT